MIWIIVFVLVAFAAVFKAAADVMDEKWSESIWRDKSKKYWDGDYDNDDDPVKRIFGYPMNGWHHANSGMIVCMLAAISVATKLDADQWFYAPALFACLGMMWNMVFNLFYNKLFIHKKYRK